MPAQLAHAANRVLCKPVLHLPETRQRAPVVRHEQRHIALRERRDHGHAFGKVERHWLLDATGFAGERDLKREFLVTARWRRYVNRVDIRR
jgi:hypothetical protein